METFIIILEIITACFAFYASYLWLKASKTKTPSQFNIHVVKPASGGPLGQPFGGTYKGHAYSQDLSELTESLSRQGKQNANAALYACLAALIQGIAIIIKQFC